VDVGGRVDHLRPDERGCMGFADHELKFRRSTAGEEMKGLNVNESLTCRWIIFGHYVAPNLFEDTSILQTHAHSKQLHYTEGR
jgi:hypothetical protein